MVSPCAQQSLSLVCVLVQVGPEVPGVHVKFSFIEDGDAQPELAVLGVGDTVISRLLEAVVHQTLRSHDSKSHLIYRDFFCTIPPTN